MCRKKKVRQEDNSKVRQTEKSQGAHRKVCFSNVTRYLQILVSEICPLLSHRPYHRQIDIPGRAIYLHTVVKAPEETG